jgi:hypothetical protein
MEPRVLDEHLNTGQSRASGAFADAMRYRCSLASSTLAVRCAARKEACRPRVHRRCNRCSRGQRRFSRERCPSLGDLRPSFGDLRPNSGELCRSSPEQCPSFGDLCPNSGEQCPSSRDLFPSSRDLFPSPPDLFSWCGGTHFWRGLNGARSILLSFHFAFWRATGRVAHPPSARRAQDVSVGSALSGRSSSPVYHSRFPFVAVIATVAVLGR